MSGEKGLYHPLKYDEIRSTKNERGQEKTDARKNREELNNIKWTKSAMEPKHVF